MPNRFTRRRLLQAAGFALAAGATRVAAAAQPAGSPPVAPRSLLILGGTGFLGPHLTEQALERGWKVTHFNRGRRRPGGMPGVETLLGDRNGQLDALKGRTWDAVIDTSGYVPRIVTMSAELLAPSVGRYLFVSSISAYASFAAPNDETSAIATLADESVEKVDDETFGALKALCERATERALPGRTTVVRPGYIVGPLDPTDRFTYWPVRVARGGEMVAPGTAADPIQVIDVRDLAAWMLGLLERGAGGTFNAVSPPRRFTMGALVDASLTASGAPTRVAWVPADVLRAQLGESFALPPWASPEGEYAGFALTSVERALATGLAIRPLVDTVRDTLAWHATRPPEQQAKLRSGLTPEQEAKVLAAWRDGQSAKRA